MIKAIFQKVVLIFIISFFTPKVNAQCPTDGYVFFSSQAAVNQFIVDYPNCTQIDGNLLISAFGTTDITDLSPLENITTVTGNLNINNNTLLTNLDGLSNLTNVGQALYINNTALTNLSGLGSITSIGGNFTITNNPYLTNLDGISSLTNIGGSFTIQNNPTLNNLDELNALTTVELNFIIKNNASLINIDGLSNLTNIMGNLDIMYNPVLTNLDGLSALTNTGNFLQVGYNPSLTSISGLSSLVNTGGDFNIIDNDLLTNIDGLISLTNVGGFLAFQSNASLTNLDGLINLTAIDGWIDIHGNSSLIDISGLQNINSDTIDTELGLSLHIVDNSNLSICNLTNFCTYLANPASTHPRTISGNLADCISAEAVIAACSLGVDYNNLSEVKLYPNPANAILNIQNSELITKLIIFDISGKKIKEHNENVSQINIENLANGIYILQVFSGDKKYIHKFSKQ